jgi:hypothetical protein
VDLIVSSKAIMYVVCYTDFCEVFNYSTRLYCEPWLLSWYSDWLRAGRLRGESSESSRVKNFLHIQTSSGAYPMGNGDPFPGGQATGA